MKKIFFTLLSVLAIGTINAQPQPGSTHAALGKIHFGPGPVIIGQGGILPIIQKTAEATSHLLDIQNQFDTLQLSKEEKMKLGEEILALQRTIFDLKDEIVNLQQKLLTIVKIPQIINLRNPEIIDLKQQLQDEEIDKVVNALEDATVMKAFPAIPTTPELERTIPQIPTTPAQKFLNIKKAKEVIGKVIILP